MLANSLPDLLRYRANKTPNDVAFYTTSPQDNDPAIIRSLSYAQVLKAIHAIANHYAELSIQFPIESTRDQNGTPPPPKTMAIYFNNSLNLTLTEFAFHLFGHASLLLSPNNSPAAVAHLLERTSASHIIVGQKLMASAKQALEILEAKGIHVTVVPEFVLPLWGSNGIAEKEVKFRPPFLTPDEEHTRPAIILHSSGSTGHPKPLSLTHKAVVASGAANFNMVGATLLPLFHGFGHHSTLRCIYPGNPLTIFPPSLPLTTKNIRTVFSAAAAASSREHEQLFAVPYILKVLADTKEGLELLSTFKIVSFAGAALPDETGDRIIESGGNLVTLYGTTETGTVFTSHRDFAADKEWNWLRASENVLKYLVMEPQGDGSYEAVVRGDFPSLSSSNRDDGSFATKDLFVQHPIQPNWYKYIGRLDDTIVHVVGEKTNPIPMELTIRSDPLVFDVIVVGAEKPHAGALVIPSDAADGIPPEEYVQRIWRSVDAANREAPTHSRILPEMMEVLPRDAELPKATKGTILRPSCYAQYKDVIDEMYRRFDSKATSGPKDALALPDLERFLKDCIVSTMGDRGPGLAPKPEDIQRDTDLFELGVTSLEAMRIRVVVIGTVDCGGHQPSQNVVYEYPTIAKLARHLIFLKEGGTEDFKGVEEIMLGLVDKYVGQLPMFTVNRNPHSKSNGHHPTGKVVVLSGATGGLGAHLLDEMIENPQIGEVITLVRAKNDGHAFERLENSLASRKLKTLTNRQGGGKVEALAASLDDSRLGLAEYTYERIRKSIDVVIHNAWSVNFNLSIASFETHNIRGAFNLISLCLKADNGTGKPAAFFFSSSVSVRQGRITESVEEVISTRPSDAAKTGYAQSKWVTENICARAARERSLQCGILRIGQMAGDTVHGVWNETEAIPLLFRSVKTINALPELDDHPSYLPIDIAAKAVVEVLDQIDAVLVSRSCKVFHIVNPNMTASWKEITSFVQRAYPEEEFKLVPPREWVKLLENSTPDLEKNPTYKLLDFFHKRFGKDVPHSMLFETKHTGAVSENIRSCPPVTAGQVSKWITRWRESGFM